MERRKFFDQLQMRFDEFRLLDEPDCFKPAGKSVKSMSIQHILIKKQALRPVFKFRQFF